ncbi:hypothetical protein ACFLQ0_02800 [Nitrospinota bacterium]
MSKKRHTVEQIIGKLREAKVLLSQSQSVPEACKMFRDPRANLLTCPEEVWVSWQASAGGLDIGPEFPKCL